MRRRKGEGYLYKHSVSKYYYFRYTVDNETKSVSLGVKDKKSAEEKAKELIKDLDLKTKEEFLYHIGEVKNLITYNRLKLDEAWNKFLSSDRRECTGATLKNHKGYWHTFLKNLPDYYEYIQDIKEVDVKKEFINNNK